MRENRPVGAALSLWSNGVKVLNWLGLGAEVAALSGGDTYSSPRRALPATLCDFSLAPVTTQTGRGEVPGSPAPTCKALLMERFGLDGIHLGKKLVGIADDGTTVTATFADGTTDAADMLGADGALDRARLRATRRRAADRAQYSGYTNVNGLVPVSASIGRPTAWTTYVADGKRAAVMPIAGDRFYFWFDIPQPSGLPHDPAAGVAPLREAFGDWAPGVQELLAAIDPATSLNRVEIWDITPFDTWTKGRVAILGDAAHNTSPDIGQGCSAPSRSASRLPRTRWASPTPSAATPRCAWSGRASSCCGHASAPGRRTRSIPP